MNELRIAAGIALVPLALWAGFGTFTAVRWAGGGFRARALVVLVTLLGVLGGPAVVLRLPLVALVFWMFLFPAVFAPRRLAHAFPLEPRWALKEEIDAICERWREIIGRNAITLDDRSWLLGCAADLDAWDEPESRELATLWRDKVVAFADGHLLSDLEAERLRAEERNRRIAELSTVFWRGTVRERRRPAPPLRDTDPAPAAPQDLPRHVDRPE